MDKQQQINMMKLLYEDIIETEYNYILYKEQNRIGVCNLDTGFDSGVLGEKVYTDEKCVIGSTRFVTDELPGIYIENGSIYLPIVDKVIELEQKVRVFTFDNYGSDLLLIGDCDKPYNIKLVNLKSGELVHYNNFEYRVDNSNACFDGIISIYEHKIGKSHLDEDKIIIILSNGKQMSLNEYILHIEKKYGIKVRKLIKNYKVTFKNGGTILLTPWGLPEWINSYNWMT